METQGEACDTAALHAKLDQIDQRANHLELPTVYASNLYTLRSHIDLVRARLAKNPEREVMLLHEFPTLGSHHIR